MSFSYVPFEMHLEAVGLIEIYRAAAPQSIDLALHKKSAKPNKSEPEAVATGSSLPYEKR
jgi:hypothetical protein